MYVKTLDDFKYYPPDSFNTHMLTV